MKGRALRIAVVYPDLLGTYGDGGNGLVLARRAAWRDIPVELLQAPSDQPLPGADVYCLGGGEDAPQVRAAESLGTDGRLGDAVEEGAVVLAVCAGFQIVGVSYPGADGVGRPGLGLLDVTTVKGTGRRAVGELLAHPLPWVAGSAALPILTGFENHGGVTTLGAGVEPLARVAVGTGNGTGDGTEGARRGRVVGTYLHGPVLARNPALADLLLSWAIGAEGVLGPVDDHRVLALRQERVVAASRRRRHRGGR
jgi:CobQ-like glutamine amidotransferase family enzyme